MQKVVGSSPIIRLKGLQMGRCCGDLGNGGCFVAALATGSVADHGLATDESCLLLGLTIRTPYANTL
jgi:hypothetical protein